MAGIHCCFRRLLVQKTSRLTDKNAVLFQFNRKRHHLVFQMYSLKNRFILQKPKLVYNANKLLIYRLASTNITESKESVVVTDLKISEVKNDSSHLNKELTQLNNESVQTSKEPEVVGSPDSNIIDESLLPPIPSEVSVAPEMNFISMGLKEPTFQSLGLGSWWPSGLVQQILEFLHINLDLPWWGSIVIITCVIRSFLLPINVKIRRESVNMMNLYMPKISQLNEKIFEAKLRGDLFSMALYNQELLKYIKDNKINFFASFKGIIFQAPVFLSMYYALIGMTKAPVESLKTGGLLWFQDLTQPDPYYILPIILSGSLLAVIETGAEGNPNFSNNFTMKWIFRGLSGILFVFSLKFASCLTWYWTISNLISLVTVAVLKIPAVRNYFNIPEIDTKSMEVLKKKQKGFIKGFKDGIENAKIASQIQNRELMNLRTFQKAGDGAVPRTFKKNPLLQKAKNSS